jgi:hypothetical protein
MKSKMMNPLGVADHSQEITKLPRIIDSSKITTRQETESIVPTLGFKYVLKTITRRAHF